MDKLEFVTDPLEQFAKDSVRLVNKCTKPDRRGTGLVLRINLRTKTITSNASSPLPNTAG